MSGKTRSSFFSLVIIAVLVFGAISPTIVHADEGTPPLTPPAETGSGCASNNDTGECPASEEAAEVTSTPDPATAEPVVSTATEVPVEITSTPEEATVEPVSQGENSTEETPTPEPTEEVAPATEEASPTPEPNILEQVPENTTVTVLDAAGQSQPLATQDTVHTIVTGNPIWCPQGQGPTPGSNGCTSSFSNFKALLTFLSGNTDYQGAGTIYIQEGVYITGGTTDFNSPDYDLSNIKNSDLTVTGGWNPTTNTVDSGSTSTFRIPFLIGTSANPWGGSLTINNLTIDKSDGSSLVLYSQGNIILSNVNITNAHNNGAGAELNAGGNVTIEDSNFIRNKQAGAIIRAGGNVAIANSSFSNPTSGRQQITGLNIISAGAVNLADVLVSGNREVGASITAGDRVTIANGIFSGTKALKGSGPSRTFWGYGLQIVTPADIVLANVTANDNFLWGASLQTDQNVVITDSAFNANTTADPHFIDDTGLIITSGGYVTLNKVEANDNRLIGASIHAVGDVMIDDSSFSNNHGVTLSNNGTPVFQGYGLEVVTQGGISLNLVNASNNTLFGAHLEAGDDIDVSSSNFDNQTSGSTTDQTGRGLEIINTGGDVLLSFVSTSNNQTLGANIQTTGTIFLDTVTATNNGSDGLVVVAGCKPVYLSDGNYSNNGKYGLSITNTALNQGGSPIFGGNDAGDVFQDPGACTFDAPAPTGGTASNNAGGIVPIVTVSQQTGSTLSDDQGSLFTSSSPITRVDVVNSALNTSVNVFQTDVSAPAVNLYFHMFAGKYIYTYTSDGIQVMVLDPTLVN